MKPPSELKHEKTERKTHSWRKSEKGRRMTKDERQRQKEKHEKGLGKTQSILLMKVRSTYSFITKWKPCNVIAHTYRSG